jgi:uncharacterized membrane protein
MGDGESGGGTGPAGGGHSNGIDRGLIAGMVLIGGATAGLAGWRIGWFYAPAVGWAMACTLYVGVMWATVWPMDPNQTERHATRDAPGRRTAHWLLVGASLVSLLDVGWMAAQAGGPQGIGRATGSLLAFISVALSWILIHTVYTLGYARAYHAGGGVGISFPGGGPPCYRDFAYLAFTIGMGYQVSDQRISVPAIRGVVLIHALISYLFGAVILGTMVSLLAGLGASPTAA